MLKKLTTLLIGLLAVCTISAKESEEELVRKSFNNYKSAILNDRGEEAVKFVDSNTIKYYSEILEKTKTAKPAEVKSLGLMDRLMVLAIRHRASKSNILSFDGKALLVYAIKEGMVGKNSVKNNSIGKVKVNGNFATGNMLVNGQATPLDFQFNKENGTWKVDLTAIFPAGTMAFKEMQKNSGKDENEFLMMLLEMASGKKPKDDIWNELE
ncbi:hypothetical protein EYV94_21340 [Puteibacter caeruleilacunae]|nr:hypothetical protein EYV94_21340 [Puteibacter caeruleilacunae]